MTGSVSIASVSQTMWKGAYITFLVAIVACGQGNLGKGVSPTTTLRSTDSVSVGLTQLSAEDTARHRPLKIRVWYPSELAPLKQEGVLDGIFISRSVTNAPFVSAPARFPLVLLSHGSGGGSSNLVWLAEYLVQHGYLAVAVDHYGNTFGNNSPEGTVAVWRRPQDLTRALNVLLSDARFGNRIAIDRVGAAGFSAGGYAVIALAGGRYHPEMMAAYCRQHATESDCQLAPGFDPSTLPDFASASAAYREPRIRAVFAMAPAVGQGFGPEDLASVHIAVSIVASTHDEMVPFEANAQRYAQLIPGAQLTPLESGGHFVFMSLCSALGFQHAREVCADITPDVDRKAIHQRVQQLALAFFDEHLR